MRAPGGSLSVSLGISWHGIHAVQVAGPGPAARTSPAMRLRGTPVLRRPCRLRGKAGLASRGTYGLDREAFSLQWTDRRGRGSSWTGRLGPSHATEWDAESDVGYDRVGAGSMAVCGYVLPRV